MKSTIQETIQSAVREAQSAEESTSSPARLLGDGGSFILGDNGAKILL